MSFYKIKLATQTLWDAYEVMGETLTGAQGQKMWEYYVELVRRSAVLPERRARSCPRVLRQPVSSWPWKTDQPSYTGSVQIKLVPV
jgi:hypothetical protein